MNFNDTNTDNPTQQMSSPNAGTGNENSTFPLGTSGDDGFDADSSFDPLAGAEGVKRSNSGTILIILVILVAAGGLFSMRTLAKVSASVDSGGDVESSIEGFIATLTGNTSNANGNQSVLLRDDDPTIEALNTTRTELQVPWVNVLKNPFELRTKSTDSTTVDPIDPNSSDRLWEQRRRTKLQSIEAASARMQLTSVLLGSSPLANINGKILRINETITMEREGVTFRLLSVDSDQATLLASDKALDINYEFTVQIDRDR